MKGSNLALWTLVLWACVIANADAEVIAGLPHPSRSQPAAAESTSQELTPGYHSDWPELNTDRLVGRSLVATCGLATACLIALWSSRRVRAQRLRSSKDNRDSMVVLETLCLAPRCTLQLVRVDAQKFLIARDPSGVRSITPVSTFADAMAEEVEPFEAVTPRDADTRRSALSQYGHVGLSLELPDADISADNTARRRDPWQGPSLKR